MREISHTLTRRDILRTGTGLLVPHNIRVANAEQATPENEVTPERIGLPEFHKGINVLVYYKDPDNTGYQKRSIETANWLTTLGTNSINYVYPIYQENVWSNAIESGKDTPTQENMRTFIREMHAVELPVTMRPSLDEASFMDSGNWRGTIQPASPTEWFRSYTDHMVKDATIAEEEKADGFCVGLELYSMEQYTQEMITMIHKIREVFSGKVFYSFNHDSLRFDDPGRIAIAKELDETWIDAFFSLGLPQDASVEQIAEAWRDIINYAKGFREVTDNPVSFSEVGILSDFKRPFRWDSDLSPEQTAEIQANYFEGICQNIGEIDGMHVWHAGFYENIDDVSTDNISFDIINRPAEDVLRDCYQNMDDSGNPLEDNNNPTA